MARTTRADLEGIVDLINRQTENKYAFTLGRAYGGYRLHTRNESVDVSPRLPAGQMYYWLHAFRSGLDFAVAPGYMQPRGTVGVA